MKITRNIKISRKQLTAHKMRTVLALIGIIIGVSSVVIMVAIGKGTQKEVLGKIEDMGTNLVIVNAGQIRTFAGRKDVRGTYSTLTMQDVQAIIRECPAVESAAPVQSKNIQVKYGNFSTNTTIIGTTPNFQIVRNFYTNQGSFFTEIDNTANRRVAVLGHAVVDNLFENYEPIGETIQIGKIPFEVIGIMESKGVDINGMDQDDQIFIPIKTALRRVFNLTYISQVNIQALSENSIITASEQISELLRERHRLNRQNKPDDFIILNQVNLLETHRETAETFTSLIVGIAAISLFIGGIGILSIMLISIRERTNEIGLRMAVGARRKDILTQFLIEALMLSIGGGCIGILFGVVISMVIGLAAAWTTSISFTPIVLAFSFSLAIGVFFGVYPAHRAATLNPIEALRSE